MQPKFSSPTNQFVETFSTPPNLVTPHGVEYKILTRCPIPPENIDTRYFNPDGTPTENLKNKHRLVRVAVDKVLPEHITRLFVTGGCVGYHDTKYKSDLDIYVYVLENDSFPLEIGGGLLNKQTPSKNNLAHQIVKEANPDTTIYTAEDPPPSKKQLSNYIDIILSTAMPHEKYANGTGRSRYVYDLDNDCWIECSEPIQTIRSIDA